MPRGFAWIRVVRLASPLATRDDHAFGTLHAEARDPQVKKHVRLFMNRSITLRFAVFLRKEPQLRPLPHGFRKIHPGAMNGSLLCPLSQPFAKMVRPPHRCSRALFYGFSSRQKPPCRGPAFPASLNPHRLDWIVTKPLPPHPLFRGQQPRK